MELIGRIFSINQPVFIIITIVELAY